jgi:hypothetical protein
MADRWTPDQHAIIDRDNRNMAEDSGVESMSQALEDIWAAIDAGNIGITAAAKDVDAICKGGGSFSYNASSSNGLNFYYDAGRFFNGASIINVAASYVALTDNATNYVEVDSAGTVSDNTSSFTADRMPLFTVVTSGGVITSVTQNKPLLAMIFSSTINGARSSTALRTKTVHENFGTINATTTVYIDLPQTTDGDVTKFRITTSNTAAASDVNYWTIAAQNKGAAGSGTTALLAATDANTSKATGGSGFTANQAREMALHGTAANLEVAGPHRVAITFTKTASAPDLENVSVAIDVAASD